MASAISVEADALGCAEDLFLEASKEPCMKEASVSVEEGSNCWLRIRATDVTTPMMSFATTLTLWVRLTMVGE
jgi:hypothetical protein